MAGRIDVRRTEGGLRLLVPVVGAWPRKAVRLSYSQADELIAAIRTGRVNSRGGQVAVAEHSQGGDVYGRAALAAACTGTYLADQDLCELGTALSAHMPDCMVPLPETPSD